MPMTLTMKQQRLNLPIPDGYELKFTSKITLKSGRVLYASQVGKRAFPILVKAKN